MLMKAAPVLLYFYKGIAIIHTYTVTYRVLIWYESNELYMTIMKHLTTLADACLSVHKRRDLTIFVGYG